MRRWISSLLSGFFLVLVILAWMLFLPVQFGGPAAYVIVNGISMEPLYHSGDLVVVRSDDSYSVGDIVTYYSANLGSYVIHRIVAVHGNHFTLKGDNNAWIDPEQPVTAQLIGKAWLHIPAFGRLLTPFRTPLGISLLAGAVGLVVFFALWPGSRTSSKAGRGKRSFRFSTGGAAMKGLARQLETTLFVLAIVFIIFLALALIAFTRDEYLSETVSVEYIHLGRFSYTAPQPGIYAPGRAVTGDPVFLKAGCQLDLRFDYSLMADSAENLNGAITLRAQAEASNGWKRSFPLAARQSFSSAETSLSAALNLCEMLDTLREVESLTGVRRDIYSLVIIPEVNLEATIAGQPVNSSFAPRLVFYLDDLQLYVLRENADLDPLLPFKLEEIATSTRLPNLIRLPGFALTVGLARVLSGLGLAAVLGVGIFLGLNLSKSLKEHPLEAVAIKYSGLLVELEQFTPGADSREVRAASIDDLARVAEHNGSVILHIPGEAADEFIVDAGHLFYRFVLKKGGKHVAA